MLNAALFLALFSFHIQGILLPKIAIYSFTPFLALLIMLSRFPKALFWAVFVGAYMDLFSSDPMGIHALNFASVTALLYRFKQHFLPEKPLHLSVFTALISSLATLFGFFFLFLFDRRVPFDGRWFFTDLLGMPILDGLYAFVWFAAPLTLFQNLRKTVLVFWLKKKNRSLTSL